MSYQNNNKSSFEKGFTLIEVAVIVPILASIAIAMFMTMYSMVRTSATEKTGITITYEAQSVLGALESDVSLTSTFLPTSDATVTDPYKPTTNGGEWSYLGDTLASPTRVLIARVYNTSTNPLSKDRKPSYLSLLGCTASTIYFNEALQYNAIYFVKSGTLYRRTALDTTQTTCEVPYQKQSCPSLDTLGLPSRNIVCVADDQIVATNVTAFTINYYPTKLSTTPLDVYVAGADPNLVTTAAAAEITITISRKTYGTDISGSATVRVSRINTVVEK